MMLFEVVDIKNTLTLYRADYEKPPDKWSTDFKCYNFETVGNKNQAGLFFLSDSIDIAHSLGNIYCKKRNIKSYYLTECRTENIRLIDFSYCSSLIDMIKVLAILNIDVFTDEYKTYEEGKNVQHLKTLRKFRSAYVDFTEERNPNHVFTQLSDAGYDDDPVGTFGQRITDFDNGIRFIETIRQWVAKSTDIDGENATTHGDSLTVFFLQQSFLTHNVQKYQTSIVERIFRLSFLRNHLLY